MAFEQVAELVVKGSFAVMLLLAFYVGVYAGRIGAADAEGRIALLPLESSGLREGVMDPAAGEGFPLAHGGGERDIRAECNKGVEVVRGTADDYGLAEFDPGYPDHVFV